MDMIQAYSLTKHYVGFRGGTTALSSLDLTVPQGGVFGFLGPNGAGKTTTIRILLGLVRPSSGSVSILGTHSRYQLHKVAHRIGSIVETPAFFPRFSARRNLMHLARLGGMSKDSVGPALERVGLGAKSHVLFKDFSLGMKQRLGLAAALIKDPELLILDEPAHGLDPRGMAEIRSLIRKLADEGRTVFVSSHLLNEMEAVCDQVAILDRGKCVIQGTVDELLGVSHGESDRPTYSRSLEELFLEVTDPEGDLK